MGFIPSLRPDPANRNLAMHTLRDQLRPHIAAFGQNRAALAAGMHTSNLSMWLNGKRVLSLERQIRLAESIGLGVEMTVRGPRIQKLQQSVTDSLTADR